MCEIAKFNSYVSEFENPAPKTGQDRLIWDIQFGAKEGVDVLEECEPFRWFSVQVFSI
jgi:hypothetical protein